MERSLYYFNKDRNVTGNWVGLSNSYFYAKEPKKALETMESAIQLLNTKYLSNENELVMNLAELKLLTQDYQGALEILKPMLESGAKYPRIYGYMGIAYTHLGLKENAIKYAKLLEGMADQTTLGSPAYFSAAIRVALNEPDEAMVMLERAVVNREVEMFWLGVIPIFDPLRTNPEFNRLLLKIGLKTGLRAEK